MRSGEIVASSPMLNVGINLQAALNNANNPLFQDYQVAVARAELLKAWQVYLDVKAVQDFAKERELQLEAILARLDADKREADEFAAEVKKLGYRDYQELKEIATQPAIYVDLQPSITQAAQAISNYNHIAQAVAQAQAVNQAMPVAWDNYRLGMAQQVRQVYDNGVTITISANDPDNPDATQELSFELSDEALDELEEEMVRRRNDMDLISGETQGRSVGLQHVAQIYDQEVTRELEAIEEEREKQNEKILEEGGIPPAPLPPAMQKVEDIVSAEKRARETMNMDARTVFKDLIAHAGKIREEALKQKTEKGLTLGEIIYGLSSDQSGSNYTLQSTPQFKNNFKLIKGSNAKSEETVKALMLKSFKSLINNPNLPPNTILRELPRDKNGKVKEVDDLTMVEMMTMINTAKSRAQAMQAFGPEALNSAFLDLKSAFEHMQGQTSKPNANASQAVFDIIQQMEETMKGAEHDFQSRPSPQQSKHSVSMNQG